MTTTLKKHIARLLRRSAEKLDPQPLSTGSYFVTTVATTTCPGAKVVWR